MNSNVIAPSFVLKESHFGVVKRVFGQIGAAIDAIRVATVVANELERIEPERLSAATYDAACRRARR